MKIMKAWTKVLFVSISIVLVLAASVAVAETNDGRDIVLIHGMWVGSYSFDPVIAELKVAGHTTYAPDLTGHGARRGESDPAVTLEDHVLDVVAVFEDNDLSDVTLVMHSYGGVPGTLAWDRLRDRVTHVVYLDAFAPEDDSKAPLRTFIAAGKNITQGAIDGMVLPPQGFPAKVRARMMPQSQKTMLGDTTLKNGPLPDGPTRTYVLAGKNNSTPNQAFRKIQATLANDNRWEHYTLPTPHIMMQADPLVVAAIIASR